MGYMSMTITAGSYILQISLHELHKCIWVYIYLYVCVALRVSLCRYLFSPNNSVTLPAALQTPGSWPAGAGEAAKSIRLMEPAGCSTWLSGSILLLSWELPSTSPFPLEEGLPTAASICGRSPFHGWCGCKTQRAMALLSTVLAISQLHKSWKFPKCSSWKKWKDTGSLLVHSCFIGIERISLRILYMPQPGENSNKSWFSFVLNENFLASNWEDPDEFQGAWGGNKGTTKIYIVVNFLY